MLTLSCSHCSAYSAAMSVPTEDTESESEKQLQDSDAEDSESEADTEQIPVDPSSSSSSSSSSDTDADSDTDSDIGHDPYFYVRSEGRIQEIEPEDEKAVNVPEINIPRITKILDSERFRRHQEEEEERVASDGESFNFPPDPENWQEEDLKELWADRPIGMTKRGWDPNFVDDEDVVAIREEIKDGRDPPIAPFYVPFRKYYPVVPTNNYDVSNPKAVIEELDRTEEFLTWVSYIFPDGNSYEGTVWDDLAHGKGVLVAQQGLVRYEGEWLGNTMEGHGVAEVEIPNIEPIPGSELEAKMRSEGQIIARDFMSPEDREWLEMDIEDSVRLADGEYEIPFYENDEWIRQFGEKPEKGRYRYAGQWKQGRMHGCGVYEVNERTTFGRFYFGDLLNDSTGCDAEVSGLHAGIAEVAAAKARMFVNKPDGMVREQRGPYSDPQHPYLYEEDDVWMAPGFINQFYEVPLYWKTYVTEVDQEREMWLNSFYKAPLRLPMPSELEYWWSKDETPEFVLINKEPEPDPEDPSKLIRTEDPLILHTPTGRIINYVEDEEHGIRLFWQPLLKEGEDVDPEKAEFLPLGFDEFYGRDEQKDSIWIRFVQGVENRLKRTIDRLEKWTEEKRKAGEAKMEMLKKEIDMVDAELDLKEAMEDLDEELKWMQEEEEKNADQDVEEDVPISGPVNESEKTALEAEEKTALEAEEEEDEEEEDDEITPSSFGSIDDTNPANGSKDGKSGKSPFAASSLSFVGSSTLSLIPLKLRQSFIMWKESNLQKHTCPPPCDLHSLTRKIQISSSVSFPRSINKSSTLRYMRRTPEVEYIPISSSFRIHSKRNIPRKRLRDFEHFNILSLHTPLST